MTAIKRYGRNQTGGRDLIVGDIHGCFTKLQTALDAIHFDPEHDRLFSVGDLVDRGPESDQATDWVAKPWFYPVAGNHEDFAICWPDGCMSAQHYAANGGAWNIANPPEEFCRIAEVFKALPVAIELETADGLVGIVHADCPYSDWDTFRQVMAAGGREAEHATVMAQWSRDRIEKMGDSEVRNVRAVVVGHTPMERMTSLGNVLFIDTIGWRHGTFTILDAATLRDAEPVPERALDWTA